MTDHYRLLIGHVCAALASTYLALFAYSWFSSTPDVIEFLFDTMLGNIAMGALGSGTFVLWVWMLTSYFISRPDKATVAWGWFLFIGHFIAVLPYFYIVYRRRAVRSTIQVSDVSTMRSKSALVNTRFGT